MWRPHIKRRYKSFILEAWLETISGLACLRGSAESVREMTCTCGVVDNGGEHKKRQNRASAAAQYLS